MALIVQKFGGTSVATTDRIKNVAKRVARWRAQGHDIVVVPSAMSGETNRLIGLAKEISKSPNPRELDVIASTGEQVTIADIALYSYTAHAPEGNVALDAYPHIRAWLARIEALPGFVAMPATAAGLRA